MSFVDLIQLIASNVWFYGGVFILVLSTLVFIHEWGHYSIARLCGVKVEAFSIGFGPELFGLDDKHGTRWKICLIPLGGYVKMFGDTDPASSGHRDEVKEGDEVRSFNVSERKVAFFSQPVWKRAAIVFAGPAINFIFAIVILAGLYGFYGKPVTPPVASGIMVESAADKAGFMPHDEIISIAGERVNRFEDIRRIVMVALDTPLEFEIQRGDDIMILEAIPEKQELTDRFGFTHSRGMLGILGPNQGLSMKNIISVNGDETDNIEQTRSALLKNMEQNITIALDRGEETDQLKIRPLAAFNEAMNNAEEGKYNALVISDRPDTDIVKHGPIDGLSAAVTETWDITNSTLKALGQMFTGTRSATELGGIIRIGAIAGDMAQQGWIAIITFTALLSINLGLINLFPVPMLDGGHLVFYALEAIKGKPVPEKIQEYAFRAGFTILIGFMLFANINDIVQLIM